MNIMKISLQEIKDFIDIIKIFKTDDIMIINNTFIISSNVNFSYIKNTQFVLPSFIGRYFCYSISELVSYICTKTLFGIGIDEFGNLYVWQNGDETSYCIYNMIIPPIGFEKLCQVALLDNSIPDVIYNDISEDNSIVELMNSLSKDGTIMYRKDKYIMTIYKGLLPLNKADKLSLCIYNEYIDGKLEFFITKFTVHKKKLDIDLYYKYRFI